MGIVGKQQARDLGTEMIAHAFIFEHEEMMQTHEKGFVSRHYAESATSNHWLGGTTYLCLVKDSLAR